MELTLYTDRLMLVPYSSDEADMAIAMFTDPDVMRYTGGPMPEDEILASMDNWCRRGGNGCIGIWCIKDRHSEAKYGSVALLPMPIEEKHTDYGLVVPGRWPDNDIEVGYFLKRSAWGNGYATEACRRVVQFAFEESPLTEIVATFDTGNTASRKVLEKAGFVHHGTRRTYGVDGVDYRISREDWLKTR